MVDAVAEHEIRFADGQVSRVAFVMAVRLTLEDTEVAGGELAVYAPLAVTSEGEPSRRVEPLKVAPDGLTAIHSLLWRPVSRIVFLGDGTVLVESARWRLQTERALEYDAWEYESRDGLNITSSGGELSYNRPYSDL